MLNEDARNRKDEKRVPISKLLSVRDVAEILGISAKTVNKLVREGKLGCVQVTSKERRFSERQIQVYIEAQSNEPEGLRVDMPQVRQVSSNLKKGGERSFGVSKADLRKEMRLWQ
ncbi:MAG: helix-turn-helix domain-containing protein [Desulfomonile tiedjei]|uniref:Helix-turn-helix domain-containing protein n=1 Tax=Desulfomonile tiedjei TaxID=2358 RepID=A0A9D6V3R2_9BACT|nr:helix-turn-helix domain-containing protein [Desulfomonile tiedjei]